MGTNFGKFIEESNRVLKLNGYTIVTEISSRFTNKQNFIKKFQKLGYHLITQKEISNYFYFFVFQKKQENDISLSWEKELKPCIYKKR